MGVGGQVHRHLRGGGGGAAAPVGSRSPRERVDSQSLVGAHGARHALAEADAALAPNLDLKDTFVGRFIDDNLHVAMLQVLGLIRTEACVRHEQYEIVNLFGVPL